MIKKIAAIVSILTVLAVLGACSATQTTTTETASATNETANNLPSLLKTDIPEKSYQPRGEITAALNNADDSQLLNGTWRHGWLNAPNCGSEHIFMADGTYYGMGGCAGFVPLRTVGKWFFPQKGVIRVTVSDWDPKYDQAGNPIHHPPGELFQYRFLDRNRMALGDGAVIAYRVN